MKTTAPSARAANYSSDRKLLRAFALLAISKEVFIVESSKGQPNKT